MGELYQLVHPFTSKAHQKCSSCNRCYGLWPLLTVLKVLLLLGYTGMLHAKGHFPGHRLVHKGGGDFTSWRVKKGKKTALQAFKQIHLLCNLNLRRDAVWIMQGHHFPKKVQCGEKNVSIKKGTIFNTLMPVLPVTAIPIDIITSSQNWHHL